MPNSQPIYGADPDPQQAAFIETPPPEPAPEGAVTVIDMRVGAPGPSSPPPPDTPSRAQIEYASESPGDDEPVT